MAKKNPKTLEEMKALLKNLEVLKKIIGKYQGQYTLGIRQDPDSQEFFFFFHVQGDPEITFQVLSVDGCDIPLRIQGGLGHIRPL